MSDKITLPPVASGYNLAAINSNFQAIEDVLNNSVLFRDQATSNEMSVDFDMNGHRVYNVTDIDTDSVTVGGVPLAEHIASLASTVDPNDLTVARYTVTITEATNRVTLPESYAGPASSLIVFRNGVQQPVSHFSFNGTFLTFSTSLSVGEVVDIVYFKSVVSAIAAGEASQVSYTPPGLGAVVTTVQNKLRESVSVKDFGAVGDGVADDTAAIQAAIDSLGASGGAVVISNGMRCLVDSNLIGKPNVTLRGPHHIVGSPNNNLSAPYGSVGGALILNPAATITLRGGASMTGLLVHRKGMTFPAPDSSAFAGTAVTIGGDDVSVHGCMFLGFAQAITSTTWQRPRIYDVNIDCVAGVLIDNCADIVYMARVHCWPFATISALGPITSLQRAGAAFKFTTLGDWNKITDCFSYGYSRGFWVNNCNSMTLSSCSADSTGSFAGQIGLMVDGTSTDTRLIACQAAAQETGYRIATSAGVQTRMIGCDSWACTNHGVLIDSGDASIFGGIHRNTSNGITVNNASSAVNINGVRFTAVAGSPINATVPNADIRIGDNDYGNWPAGSPVVNNANRPVVSVASADPLSLPAVGTLFQVTGTSNFGTLNSGWAGRMVVLKFTDALTVYDGGASLNLNGNFVATAGDTLTLMHDGTAWYEVARSAN